MAQTVIEGRIIERMRVIVEQMKAEPTSMTNRDRYALAIWAMENELLGLVSRRIADRFIELVCPDYWECYQAGVRGEE